jgi:hypothetical protein
MELILPLGVVPSQLEEPQTLLQSLAPEQTRVREPWDKAVASPLESALLEVSHQILAPLTWAKQLAATWERNTPGPAILPLGALLSQLEEPQTLPQGFACVAGSVGAESPTWTTTPPVRQRPEIRLH